MSGSTWGLLAFGAVMAFWMVGAHNRLVELRNRIADAWTQVDEPLRKRRELLPELVAGLRGPLADEHSALDALLVAQAQLQAVCERLRVRPVQADAAATFVVDERAVDASLSRVLSLIEQRAELRDAPQIAEGRRELADAAQRLGFARQMFNDAVERYNAAARQFPTRAVARLFNFGPAGSL